MDWIAKSSVVGIGGFLGANLRYWLGGWVQSRLSLTFPWQTLIINVSGSILIGLFMGLALSENWSSNWRLFVAIGILGGYTTYSTFSYETVKLLEDRSYGEAAFYSLGTAVLSVVGAFVGLVLARALTRGAA
ncbi:MAG: fluoride efflux transporter CrcB [Fimbriimonadales bacterium]